MALSKDAFKEMIVELDKDGDGKVSKVSRAVSRPTRSRRRGGTRASGNANSL